MKEPTQDITQFRAWRDLEGNIHLHGCYKRNGEIVANFTPHWLNPPSLFTPARRKRSARKSIPDLFANLTEIEKRTWKKLLAAQSPEKIAGEEGVTRSAVYERIRGNGNGQGGMIKKNRWVAKWWRLRKQSRKHDGNN